jgi:hypothetical protein
VTKSEPLGYYRVSSTSKEDEVQSRGVGERKEDGGSPSGGGEELVIIDGLAQVAGRKLFGSLTRNVIRRWTYPPFEPPPLHVCNQEERTTNSEAIGIGERVEGENRGEEMSEEECEVSATSPKRVSVLRTLNTQ